MDCSGKTRRPRCQLNMFIAREGYPFAAAAILIATVIQLTAGTIWAFPLWVGALFILQFFRDPIRVIPTDENLVVSPADGKVVAVERINHPHNGMEATRIAIFLDIFSVHATRIPISGKILKQSYVPGKFFNAAVDKSSTENERNILVIGTKDSQEVTCVQIAGLIARRILCYVEENEEVTVGQRYGFIRFGSRVELYLPLEYKVYVNIGDTIKGGSDVVASTV